MIENRQHDANIDAGTDIDVDTDTLLAALADERRRHVLRCLCEYETPMTIADLADEVAAREYGSSSAAVSPEERERLALSLYHSHVPRLADADLVTYERDERLVEPATSVDVQSLLEQYPG